jgi:hypothetical protein
VNDISIAQDGAMYVTGQTISSDFPSTPGVFSRQPLGQFDGYLAKIVEAPQGDLALAKSGTWLPASHELRYTLAVSNKGATANSVTVTDRLPANTQLRSCETSGTGTCGLTGDTITVRYPSLPPAASATATLVLTPSCAIPDRTQVRNQAHVESLSADANPANNTAEAVVQVTNPPPALSAPKPDPSVLWPPNHKMRDVRLSYIATDSCGAVSCTVQVSSSDPRATSADWLVVDAHHVRLRAERSGGRTRDYRIAVTCRDAAGGAATKTVSVVVPANQAMEKR